VARLPLPPITLFVQPSALCDGMWELGSTHILCDKVWEVGFLDVLHIRFWNATLFNVLCIGVKFWDVTSPSFLVPHFRTFEALHGKFWANRSMVNWWCKIDPQHINFACALSLWLQMGATLSLPNAK
jgi:hypothetical protein